MQHRILFFITMMLGACLFVDAQEQDTSIVVRQIDLRAEAAETAVVSALEASDRQVIIVMVQNGSPDLIAQTKNDLRGLMRVGYERLVLVFAQPFMDDPRSIISIYAGGHTYAIMKDVLPGAQTSADFLNWLEMPIMNMSPESNKIQGLKLRGSRSSCLHVICKRFYFSQNINYRHFIVNYFLVLKWLLILFYLQITS